MSAPGVSPPAVEGVSASSTACDKEDRAAIGGRTGGGFVGIGDMAASPGPTDLGGDFFLAFEFGDATGGLPPNPPKEPNDPDNLLEKLLLLLCDVLLDAVD